MSSKTKYSRLQVEVPSDFLEGIDELRSMIGMRTRKEFVDASLTILAWAVRETMKGRTIGSIDSEEGTYEELIMPCLKMHNYYHETAQNKKQPQKKAEKRERQSHPKVRDCEEPEVATT